MPQFVSANVARFLHRRGFSVLTYAVIFGLTILATGCGKKGKDTDNGVSGNVTLGGEAVRGMVKFFDKEKEFGPYPITEEGDYNTGEIPKGKYWVIVGNLTATGGGTGAPAPVVPGAGGKKDEMKMPGMKGATAPAKYSDPKKPLLTFEVTGGKETFNIKLEK